jgi:hypothetical protein
MPYINLIHHLVNQKQGRIITKELKPKLLEHIKENSKTKISSGLYQL